MHTDSDPLAKYRSKRNFGKTLEPGGEVGSAGDQPVFVIQKHAASRLHYDFRLELEGVMVSWAVPKGPSYDPKDKRIAVQTEDHPISYNSFEGTIPPKQYGAGTVILWDRGTWEPVGDPRAGLAAGKLVFTLHGQKMAGLWELVRIGKPGDRQMMWILFKKKDTYARPLADYDVISALPDSVVAKPLGPATKAHGSAIDGQAKNRNDDAHAALASAIKAPLPEIMAPQLATLTTGLPPTGDWTFEIKFDGYRLMTRIDKDGKAHLITRGGHDWSSKMPGLVKEMAALRLTSSWLDGEIVVLGPNGVPNFNALQNAFDRSASDHIVYFLFDVPFFEGYDLRNVPLRERRALLCKFLEEKQTEQVRYSADFEADPASILQSACKMELEGLIAKRGDAPYVSSRTETWLKLKCKQRQEFVIGGFTDRSNTKNSAEIGSLLLGVYSNDRKLVSVGSVGTGWNAKTASELKTKLLKLEIPASPFSEEGAVKKGRWSKRAPGSERWVKLELVAEVDFAEWTSDGSIRHPTFQGLRLDKPAREIRREDATAAKGVIPLKTAAPNTRVSNPERVIDASTGLTKLDLVRYYESVAEWKVPHLKGRPCSLVRGPSGIAGELFFQKHSEKIGIPEVKNLDAGLWPGHEALLEIPTPRAIAGAAQLNVIEFHTWNANVKNIGKPDRVIFDIDPGEGVTWPQIQEAAQLTRAFLQDLGLQAWLKTSGGKGLHLVVPLAPRHGWDTVKGFSQAVVEHMARVIPSRFVIKSGAGNRIGKIFIDYLRNSHGATTAAAFSARARPGIGVSMPVPWELLGSLKSGAHWTISTAREHLSFQTVDPWAEYWMAKQSLTQPMKALGYKAVVERVH